MFRTATKLIAAAAVAALPLATLTAAAITLGAEPAIAKSKDSKGGGKKAERSGKKEKAQRGKSAKAKKATKSKATKAAASASKATTKVKVKAKPQKASKPTTVKVSAKPKVRPEKGSKLGNMNGALNANINAVLAHIRNGNTNGPVGMVAALAVANAAAAEGQIVLEQEAEFAALDAALAAGGYASVDDYLAARNGIGENADVELALDTLAALDQQVIDGTLTTDSQEYIDAQADLAVALETAGFADTASYEDAVIGTGGDETTDLALIALGGDAELGTAPTDTRPTVDDVAVAVDSLATQSETELAILDNWNKNPDASPEITEEEQALLDALNARLDAEAEAIAATIAAQQDAALTDPEGEELPEEEEVVILTDGITPTND